MKKNKFKKNVISLSESERRKRKREVIIIISVIAIVAFLTYAENRIIHFGGEFPISNTILMFILININLLLLLLLIFLVFRNLVKLLYERRRKVMGARLRTRLVMAFIGLTLLPTIVLFFFSINFITSSIEFWFNVPIEQALENSLLVGRSLYQYLEDHNRHYLERISYQIKTRKLLKPEKKDSLSHYIKVVQRAFYLHSVEVYSSNSTRLAWAYAPQLEKKPFSPVGADALFNKFDSRKKIHSISEHAGDEELRRTIGTVPFGVKSSEASAFVVVSVLIPPDLSNNMAAISKGFEEYQQIKLLKDPIQVTYYINISIVALLVLFCAIWFGLYLAKSISIPIKDIAEGTRRVAEGDLNFKIDRTSDDEIGSLVDSFNKMTRDLKISRDQLELSTRMLRQQNVEIEERRQYMEIVLKNVSTGVITLDANGFVITINKSAEKMLNIPAADILKKNFKKLLTGQYRQLADEIMETLGVSRDNSVQFPLRLTIDGRPKSFMMHINALKDDTGRHIGLVMVFDDLTDQEKAQRMAAWREVARRIAHEVKNPLTPISLSAQRLKRKYSGRLNEPVFDECTQTIIDHVELIRNLVNEFSAFARFPTANPSVCELIPVIDETVALYREAHPNVRFDLAMPDNGIKLNIDRQQIKQALINLVDNAVGAIHETGVVSISVNRNNQDSHVVIEVADNGIGISEEDKVRLFEPYFSTKKSGMGLGLAIVNTIIADHNGQIRVQDNDPNGARFIIELPA